MGRQANGSIIPIPRNRVMSTEEETLFQKCLDDNPTAIEIFYQDGSVVLVTSTRQWRDAPDTSVQLVVVSYVDTGYAVVYGMEQYRFGGWVKTGNWMDDVEFWDLVDSVASKSSLV